LILRGIYLGILTTVALGPAGTNMNLGIRIDLPDFEHTNASIIIKTNSAVAISSSLENLGELYIRGQLTA
jgi:hypothetical protein